MSSTRSRWFAVFWLALAVKIILAAVLPLSNDEAYYWVWGHHLQWSYYDHPAGVAVLMWMGQIFEPLRDLISGHDFAGVVRIPAVIAAHFTLLIFRKLIGPSISESQHLAWLVVVLTSPFFGIGSLVVTPDLPLVLTWALSLFAFRKYLDQKNISSALLLGAALGLGFCSKYLIVIFVPIALIYIAAHRDWATLKPSALVAVITSGLFFSAPVWGWNAANDWVSFRFQLSHGLDQEAKTFSNSLQQFFDYGGAQLALLSPLVLFTFWKRNEPERIRFLKWFGWGPVLFFAWTSFKSPVEANWPIAGHISLLILASINDSRRDSRSFLSHGMVALWSLASMLVIYQAFHPTSDFFGVPSQNLKTHEFVRYGNLETLAKSDPTLYASSYQMAGALSIAARRTVPKLAGINRTDFFDTSEIGRPKTDSFSIALDQEWPWPDWIAASGYVERSRRIENGFTIVEFQRK